MRLLWDILEIVALVIVIGYGIAVILCAGAALGGHHAGI